MLVQIAKHPHPNQKEVKKKKEKKSVPLVHFVLSDMWSSFGEKQEILS
jgi:hypothetical protein